MNGDIRSVADIRRLRTLLGEGEGGGEEGEGERGREVGKIGYMVSRAALWDPSVLRRLKASLVQESCDDAPVAREGKVAMNALCAKKGAAREDGKGVAREDDVEEEEEEEEEDVLYQGLRRLLYWSAVAANCRANTLFLLQSQLAGRRQLHARAGLRWALRDARGLCEMAAVLGCGPEVAAERERQRRLVVAVDEARGLHPHGPARGSSGWPGVVAYTSHSYSSKYFDDNYYVAFHGGGQGKRCREELGAEEEYKVVSEAAVVNSTFKYVGPGDFCVTRAPRPKVTEGFSTSLT
jgi:hypothetical protein